MSILQFRESGAACPPGIPDNNEMVVWQHDAAPETAITFEGQSDQPRASGGAMKTDTATHGDIDAMIAPTATTSIRYSMAMCSGSQTASSGMVAIPTSGRAGTDDGLAVSAHVTR